MVSRSQIDRLGDRLRKGESRDGDEELLHEFLVEHDAALARLVGELRALSVPNGPPLLPTSRVKTIDTLVEKLAREKIGLSSIRDVAGARVTVGERLHEQDVVRDALVARFDGARVIDRRADPRSGYRAVHVVVKFEGCWAEIQVRTRLQHRWAEAYERAADQIGREIRYGAVPAEGTAAHEVFAFLQSCSKWLESVERRQEDLDNFAVGIAGLSNALPEVRAALEHDRRALDLVLEEFLR